jgi:glycosyltransferase involved in cell wall biosynthesis
MKIFLSTNEFSVGGAHGGSVIASRNMDMLRRAGVNVTVAHPEYAVRANTGSLNILAYVSGAGKGKLFHDQRRNCRALVEIEALIKQVKPDVVYDVHGPMWPIEAAINCGIPVVSMIGDYRWFCQRTFLVDGWLKRCSGPETTEKCYECLRNNDSWKRKVLQSVYRMRGTRALLGVLLGHQRAHSFDLWSALIESRVYLERLRQLVSHYIIGDQQAYDFFTSNGIPEYKITRIPQAIPNDALTQRPRATGRPVIDRPLRIGFVGRLDPDKGIKVLTRAFELLAEEAPVELWIVNAIAATEEKVGRQFSDLQKFHFLLTKGRIKLFRPNTTDELYRLMAQMDVGVIPSIQYEAPCLVMLEMVAQKTPIVRSESRGMEHVIQDGVNGRTFPYGDSLALGSILTRILEEPVLLNTWRSHLPEIPPDTEYGRRLLTLFASVATVNTRSSDVGAQQPGDRTNATVPIL